MSSPLHDPAMLILETRPDWASGVAKSEGSKELKTLWFGAVIMNVLGVPVVWVSLFGEKELPLYIQVVLPAFTLLGLLVLIYGRQGLVSLQSLRPSRDDPRSPPGVDRGTRRRFLGAPISEGRSRGFPSDVAVRSGSAGEDE